MDFDFKKSNIIIASLIFRIDFQELNPRFECHI